MKVLHVCESDSGGGAAIAASRLHRAERRFGLDSRMLVLRLRSNDPFVESPPGRVGAARARAVRFAAKRLAEAFHRGEPGMLSLGVARSGLGAAINRSDADLVHLHWVGAETMTLEEIAQINKPLVWTLHDMWPISGAEHYRTYPPGECGLVDQWTWRRKKRLWSGCTPVLVCPSRWIAEAAALHPFHPETQIEVVPNTLEAEVFAPIDQVSARQALGLPKDGPIVLFGAQNSVTDRRKGFDFLLEALSKFRATPTAAGLTLAIFGAQNNAEIAGFPTVWLGQLNSARQLAQAYSAADVFVAPSRQDNLPNTVVEAQCCGTPVAAFNIGGMRDIVDQGKTGFLAAPFDTTALSDAIGSSIALSTTREEINAIAAQRFSPEIVAEKHAIIYQRLI